MDTPVIIVVVAVVGCSIAGLFFVAIVLLYFMYRNRYASRSDAEIMVVEDPISIVTLPHGVEVERRAPSGITSLAMAQFDSLDMLVEADAVPGGGSVPEEADGVGDYSAPITTSDTPDHFEEPYPTVDGLLAVEHYDAWHEHAALFRQLHGAQDLSTFHQAAAAGDVLYPGNPFVSPE